jgi:hypothetical protein
MSVSGRDYPISKVADKSSSHICSDSECPNVSKQARKNRVLAFLVDTRLALPRTVLFRNLQYRGAEFSDGSLKNYLRELDDEGLVARIDAEKFAEGKVVLSDDDPGYWIPTNDGVDYIESIRAEEPDEIDTSHL